MDGPTFFSIRDTHTYIHTDRQTYRHTLSFIYIDRFKMKLKLLTSQLEKKDLSQFLHLKEQSECDDDDPNFIKYFEKIKLLQDSFENHFHDFAKEEDCMSSFIKPIFT